MCHGVMEMGNIVPSAGIEPTSLVFWASVLTITPPRVPEGIILTMLTCLCSSLPEAVRVPCRILDLGLWN